MNPIGESLTHPRSDQGPNPPDICLPMPPLGGCLQPPTTAGTPTTASLAALGVLPPTPTPDGSIAKCRNVVSTYYTKVLYRGEYRISSRCVCVCVEGGGG